MCRCAENGFRGGLSWRTYTCIWDTDDKVATLVKCWKESSITMHGIGRQTGRWEMNNYAIDLGGDDFDHNRVMQNGNI